MISLRETVQLMCEIKINMNIQRIHCETKKYLITKEECENKMLGEIYLSEIFIQWHELLVGITHCAI